MRENKLDWFIWFNLIKRQHTYIANSAVIKIYFAVDSDDLELVDMLQNLDEKNIEEDSVMGTQVYDSEEELDETEYTKVFDDDTVLIDPCKRYDKVLSYLLLY